MILKSIIRKVDFINVYIGNLLLKEERAFEAMQCFNIMLAKYPQITKSYRYKGNK